MDGVSFLRWRVTCIAVIAITSATKFYAQAQDQTRPNFIFILTDDQSYGLMGCEGNAVVKTPNLDKLAAEGVHFTNAHITSAICTPSRIQAFAGDPDSRKMYPFQPPSCRAIRIPTGWRVGGVVKTGSKGWREGI